MLPAACRRPDTATETASGTEFEDIPANLGTLALCWNDAYLLKLLQAGLPEKPIK
jgi:hypothetical protein